MVRDLLERDEQNAVIRLFPWRNGSYCIDIRTSWMSDKGAFFMKL
jgi:hypothetical protein